MRVRYYGHFGLQTGYGRAATDFALALHRHTSLELDLRCLNSVDLGDDNRCLPLAPLVNAGGHPDVVLVHTLPRDCPEVLRRDGSGAPAVAYTTWEASTAPYAILAPLWGAFPRVLTPSVESMRSMRHDEAPPGSSWVRRTPLIVPHTFDDDANGPFFRQPLTQPGTEPYVFYTVGAWNVRKNPAAIVRAFAYAFAADDNVCLRIHCPGALPGHFYSALAATGLERNQMPPITMTANLAPWSEVNDLHLRANCYVTTSRGEAWNLGAFEAAVHGRDIVSPGGLGSDDFLDGLGGAHVTSLGELVPASMDVMIEEHNGMLKTTISGPGGLTCREVWREPNLVEISTAMRAAYFGRSVRDYVASATRNRKLFSQRYGYAAVAEIMTNALEEARG